MNLHIFQDGIGFYSNEIVMRIRRLSPDKENIYINISNEKQKIVNRDINCFTSDLVSFLDFINKIGPLKRIYFHSYNYLAAYILGHLKSNNPEVVVCWIFWSGEFYNLPEFLGNLFFSYSKQYLPRISFYKKVRSKLSDIKNCILDRPVYRHSALIKSYQKIDYFATILESDYKNVVEYSQARMKFVHFAYLSYEQLIEPHTRNSISTGDKIMINHSSDPSLNHYEILTLMKEKKINNRMFLPLAYGDKKYRDDLKEEARMLFGDQIEIQEDFISLEKYTEKLTSVGYSVFNCAIQQGIGNMIILLWLGVKIFLRKENPAYKDFKKWGLWIYSVQSDLPEEDFKRGLTQEQIQHNRKIIKAYMSEEIVNSYYQNLLNLLCAQ
jgi:dTDP-N-acetylfucosamine:lipid II N-acetylfucosaminyltransferase